MLKKSQLIDNFSRRGEARELPFKRYNRFSLAVLIVLPALVFVASPLYAISVIDDSGVTVTLNTPAKRIISLAPHTTELLFSAGAGDKLIGVVEFSDYPVEATQIPLVGTSSQFDFERIVQLQPDLIVGWESGNPANLIAKLRAMSFKLYLSEPRQLADVSSNTKRLAKLAGTTEIANSAIATFDNKIHQLKQQNHNKSPVRIFYEIWNAPLMTLSGKHIFSELVRLCGGENIFDQVDSLAPQVSIEAVIKQDPELILASGMSEARPDWLDDWKKWKNITAVKNNQLAFIPADYLQRSSMRLAIGAERLCTALDNTRRNK